MATTTNFGWTTPDDTDLVKDGAAAIRTLGSSVDTSFVDLLGGTTGQVLSKASATDLDFTWASAPASGLTLISRTAVSGAVTHDIDSVFAEATYSDYMIVVEKGSVFSDQLRFQLRYGSTTQTTGYYTTSYGFKYTGVVQSNSASLNGNFFILGGPGGGTKVNLSVINLSILGNTAYYTGQITNNDDGSFFAGGFNQSMGGSITGIRLFTAGGINNITGTISIYGMAR
jgi:hypothetical protein